MGALFGGDSPAPTFQAPPPPPPPPVIEDTKAKEADERHRLLSRQGIEKTLLTSADGTAAPEVDRKKLTLGE